MRRQIVFFAISGAIGFVVDAGIVTLLVTLFDTNRYYARIASFLCAATTTWAFNRRVTFAGQGRYGKRAELARYLVAMAGGFALNYGTYAFLVYQSYFVHEFPVIGVAAGSIVGAGLNFFSSKYWIFRAHDDERSA